MEILFWKGNRKRYTHNGFKASQIVLYSRFNPWNYLLKTYYIPIDQLHQYGLAFVIAFPSITHVTWNLFLCNNFNENLTVYCKNKGLRFLNTSFNCARTLAKFNFKWKQYGKKYETSQYYWFHYLITKMNEKKSFQRKAPADQR